MAYIRQRTTKAGSLSTALVEAYRDEQGQPRQRLLANLHGEPDVVRALAKATCRRVALENFIAEQRTVAATAPDDYDAKLVARYFAKLDAKLAAIEREIEVLSAHCTASEDEIQAAAKEHQRALEDAQAAALGALFYEWKIKKDRRALAVELRRLRE
jgi:hypothetical protein